MQLTIGNDAPPTEADAEADAEAAEVFRLRRGPQGWVQGG